MHPVTLVQFYAAVRVVRGNDPDADQKQAIDAGPTDPLFIVAGPGSGKTTVLTLRILKLIFVDGIAPRSILATTFTNKAAAELRSRILGWGFQLQENLLSGSSQLTADQKAWLEKIDINQVITGTIDSLAERIMRENRQPGQIHPILADEFVSSTLLLTKGLLGTGLHNDSDLDAYLLRFTDRFGYSLSKKATLLKNIWGRMHNDRVSWLRYRYRSKQRVMLNKVSKALNEYKKALKEQHMMDFSMLESEFFQRLLSGKMKRFTDGLKVVLVDEYQDTNLLQESIYFELAATVGGALTVVGDDDQAMYRFRGATVELFSNYENRYQQRFAKRPIRITLSNNYRSTANIIDFVNTYAGLDAGYQVARVAGKPKIQAPPYAVVGCKVLGLFRPTIETLARDLAQVVHAVFRGNGYRYLEGGKTHIIERHPAGGAPGDCALLCSSPAEYNYKGDKKRLPGLLRDELSGKNPAIEIFNPRGQDINDLEVIRLFGGLLLKCLDGNEKITRNMKLTDEMKDALNVWFREADAFLNQPSTPRELVAYVNAWASRTPSTPKHVWPDDINFLELVYDLLYWFKNLHDDPEGQVYLEIFTRQTTAGSAVSGYEGHIIWTPSNQGASDKSVEHLIRNVLGPIALGSVPISEDLVDMFPRNRLSVLSIHQSKGLEFPIVIVDVGADFKGDYSGQRPKRFPEKPGEAQLLEDEFRPYSKGLAVPARSGIDRVFDDLYRQYFVAFSRAQEVLILAGLNKCIQTGQGAVKTVTTGYDRIGNSHWNGFKVTKI